MRKVIQKKSLPKHKFDTLQWGNRVRAYAALALISLCGILALQIHFTQQTSLPRELLNSQLPFLCGIMPDIEEAEQPDGITIQRVDIDEGVSREIRIELLGNPQQLANIDLSGTEPKILIYHTHTTEAYTQTEQYQYEECGQWRTLDNTRNVVAIGKKLADLLSQKYGIAVIHDTTNHEPPKLATSYSRSLVTMQKYKAQYPSLTMFIDVHRDAYTPKGENTDYVVINGQRVARMMFVVGTGEGATGQGFGEMPDFNSNYALAKAITERLLLINDRFMRNIRIKTGRYNQHVSNQCLLVEIGHNANTFEEALAAVDYLAEAIAYCAGIEPQVNSMPWTP